MTTSSTLFKRITTCAEALHGQQPSYKEVLKSLSPEKATGRKNKDLTKASLEFIKLGFPDRSAAKAKFAFYVSNLIANGNDNDGLAKEVCDRFRVIDNFDRPAMDEIFNFCLCNDRFKRMLDNTLISKTRPIHPTIKHESNVEFVIIFFNVMENLVARGHALTDLGFPASVSSSDMEIARSIMEKHLDAIAAKCFPCFKKQVLKIPRKQNNLFPSEDALPIVSIGCAHVNYDQATVATLKESLIQREEKEEFLQMMLAVISHASMKPAVTFQGLHVESVKTYFLKNILDEDQAKETLELLSVPAEVLQLRKEIETARMAAEALRKEADIARNEAGTARKKADAAVEEADTARNEADTARKEADTARKEADAAKKEADAARKETEGLKRANKSLKEFWRGVVMDWSTLVDKMRDYSSQANSENKRKRLRMITDFREFCEKDEKLLREIKAARKAADTAKKEAEALERAAEKVLDEKYDSLAQLFSENKRKRIAWYEKLLRDE